MKSRTSFFNPTVLRKDITRFAPLWVLYTIFTLMVIFLISGQDNTPARFANNAEDVMRSMGMVNFAYGGLCAVLLFGDLFSPRLCNALHAMPLRREGWFFTHCIAGFLFCLVPNLLATLVSFLLLQQYYWIGLLWLGLMLMQFLFFFATGVLASVSAGNRLGAAAIYAIVNFLAVIGTWLVFIFYDPLLYGIELNTEALMNLSPVVRFTDADFVKTSYDNMASALVFEGFVPADWRAAGIAAAVGVVFLLLSLLIYRKRALESAGDFISLRPIGPVFLVIYTLCAGSAFYFVCDQMAEKGKYIFLALGLAVGFFTGLMLLEKKVNVFKRKAVLGFVLLLAIFGSTMALTWLDPVGVTRYVPDSQEVSSVQISPYASYYYRSEPYMTLTDRQDIQTIVDLHQDLVTNRSTNKNAFLYLNYTLTDGSTVNRSYYVDPNSDNGKTLQSLYSRMDCLLSGVDQTTLLQNSYALEFYSYHDDFSFVVSASTLYTERMDYQAKYDLDINHYYYTKQIPGEEDSLGVDVAMVRELFQAMEKDCQAGTMAQLWEFHQSQNVYGYIRLDYYIPKNGESINSYDMVRSMEITVYEDCKNTVSYLQSLQ